MNKIGAIALALLLLIPSLVHADDKALKDEVNAKVTQLVLLLKDSYAQEHQAARGIQLQKKALSNAPVAAAVFTIEGFGGGNNYVQYLAVFEGEEDKSERQPTRFSLLDFMVVGGKGMRSIEFDKIKIQKTKNGLEITIPSKEYGPDDPMCCPRIKSTAKFKLIKETLAGGRLKEIKKTRGKAVKKRVMVDKGDKGATPRGLSA